MSDETNDVKKLEARAGGMLPGIAAIAMFMIFIEEILIVQVSNWIRYF